MTLLVFGSALDTAPASLVARWTHAGIDAVHVTPAQLSQPGWTLRVGNPAAHTAAVDGRMLTAGEIDAVVCALAFVSPSELVNIDAVDRDYVAQEMTAFVLAWLSALQCPVLDRPTAVSLCGNGWSPWEWASAASQRGIAAQPGWEGHTTTVTVVGERAYADTSHSSAVEPVALALASSASARLVTLHFTPSGDVVGASPCPDVGRAEVADTLLQELSVR